MSRFAKRLIVVCVCALVFAASVFLGINIGQKDGGQPADIPQAMLWSGAMGQEVRDTISGGYLASQVAMMRRDYDKAAYFANLTMQKGQEAEALKKRNLRIFVSAGDFSSAEKIATTMLDQQDSLATLVEVGRLTREQSYLKAQAIIDKAPTDGLYRLIHPVLKAWIHAGQRALSSEGETQADAAVLLSTRQDFLATFMLYQRALIHDWLGEYDEADKAYAAIALKPDVAPYRMVQAIANYYLRRGRLEQARGVYDAYIEHNPNAELQPPKLPESEQIARQSIALIKGPNEGVAEIYFTAASLLFGERVHQETILYLRLALALRPDFPPAQMLLASVFEQQDKHEEAVKLYRSIDTNSIFYKQGRLRIALNYHAAGNAGDAIALLKQILAEEPDNRDVVVLLGDVYRREKDYESSAKVFAADLKRAPQEERGWEFYHKYAMALERSRRWDRAEEMFLKALEREEDQPDVLNYLGYSWLERGVKLKEAKDLIERAYVQKPDQAHIIDSMGWAHFMLGEYDRALPLLEEAAELAPHDPTVNEHLGDVYWRVGRRLEARFQWERALTFEPDDEAAIRVKLKQGLAD